MIQASVRIGRCDEEGADPANMITLDVGVDTGTEMCIISVDIAEHLQLLVRGTTKATYADAYSEEVPWGLIKLVYEDSYGLKIIETGAAIIERDKEPDMLIGENALAALMLMPNPVTKELIRIEKVIMRE